LFQSQIQETSQMAKKKVEEYINARHYSPENIKEDKNDELNNNSANSVVNEGENTRLQETLIMEDMTATNKLTPTKKSVYNGKNNATLNNIEPPTSKSPPSSRMRDSQRLRSPYKNRQGEGKDDGDAISAGEWASALGMAGERLKLASPR
jgi:hypothetical protein